jgi:2-polyprenyl-3-methyl-5-hydroxy-6-metoxy-1,4-benzoquinol methylase
VVYWKPRNPVRPLRPEDLDFSERRYGETLTLWRCRACTFIFADGEELAELAEACARRADAAYEENPETRGRQMRHLLRAGLAARPGARTVLDIGAGAGALLAEAQRAGLEAVGVEPSCEFVQRARAAPAVEVAHGVFAGHPALSGRTFDLVFLADVIEHVAEPVELLQAAAGAMAPGGAVVVVTPDVASYFARRLRGAWWHYRLTHVGYFNRHSLTRAARRAGLLVESRGRATWYFRIGDLAKRLAGYLPWLSPLAWVARRVPPLSWLYPRIVPVNLRDTMWVVLRPVGEAALGPSGGETRRAPADGERDA